MKLAVLAVVCASLLHEEPEEALHPGASLLEEGVPRLPAALAGTPASAFTLPTGGLTRAAGRRSVTMQVPDPEGPVPKSFAFKAQLPEPTEFQLPEPRDLELAPEPRGPGLLQGLFNVRSEERQALRLKDEMPKEPRETIHGRLVHWALMEGELNNPNFVGKTLLELREQAPELARIIQGDSMHAGDEAGESLVVKNRVRQRTRDFARQFVEKGPWVPSKGASSLQWADETARSLVETWGYAALRSDLVFGPFLLAVEKLFIRELRSDENPYMVMRVAANLNVLGVPDQGQLAELVAAEALECMKAEYSQSFVEAAIAMFNRFQADYSKNLATYYTRTPKQELAAMKEDLLSMPNTERRNLVLRGMAAGGLIYSLLPAYVNEFFWGKPKAESPSRPSAGDPFSVWEPAGPDPASPSRPSAGDPFSVWEPDYLAGLGTKPSSAEQDLRAISDAAIQAGLYKRR